MAILAMRGFAIMALLSVFWDVPSNHFFVQAQESEEAPAAEAESTDAATEEGGTDEQKGQQFVDSAKELQEKLAQLKALLDAKGDSADPGLKEKLSGLEAQLGSLGLDGLTGGGGSSPELTKFLGACVAMSMRRAGMQRPATLSALRRLAEGKMPPEEAAKNEFWRMVGVCVGEMKEDEFADFNAGKVKILPKAYVDLSKKPEGEQKVLEIDAQVWDELKKVSAGLLQELTGGGAAEKPPFAIGYLAMIPVIGAVAFLGKLFLDMQKREDEKQKKASKREGKKSK